MEPLDIDAIERQEPPGEIFVRPAWYELYWLRTELWLKKPMTARGYIGIGLVIIAFMLLFALFGPSCQASAGPG